VTDAAERAILGLTRSVLADAAALSALGTLALANRPGSPGLPGGPQGWSDIARLHALWARERKRALRGVDPERLRTPSLPALPYHGLQPGEYRSKAGVRLGKAAMHVRGDGTGIYVNSRGETRELNPAQVMRQHQAGMSHRHSDLEAPAPSALPEPSSAGAEVPPAPDAAPKDRRWRSAKTRYSREDAQSFVDHIVRGMPPGSDFTIGGSWRRGAPTVGDLDVMVPARGGPAAPRRPDGPG
jgi:hypothetical protein